MSNAQDKQSSLRAVFISASKGIPALLALVLIANMFVLGITYAYLAVSTDEAYNELGSAEVSVSIYENDAEIEGLITVNPGKTETKVALGVPENKAPSALRASFGCELLTEEGDENSPVFRFFDNGTISAPDETNSEIALGGVTLHFNPNWSDSWKFENGFFYYKHIAEPGMRTDPLLLGITVSDEIVDTVRVGIHAEAIQAYPQEALEEWGWSF